MRREGDRVKRGKRNVRGVKEIMWLYTEFGETYLDAALINRRVRAFG